MSKQRDPNEVSERTGHGPEAKEQQGPEVIDLPNDDGRLTRQDDGSYRLEPPQAEEK